MFIDMWKDQVHYRKVYINNAFVFVQGGCLEVSRRNSFCGTNKIIAKMNMQLKLPFLPYTRAPWNEDFVNMHLFYS